MLAAAVHPWAWRAHPEVWVLVGGLSYLYWYAVTKIGPKAVPAGTAPVTIGQRMWFVAAMLTMWLASDWPVHDIGEQYLYSVHMFQHLVLTMVLPPMLLFATPEWLLRLILGHGLVEKVFMRLTRPIIATVIFNALFVFTHWPVMVNNAVQIGWLHFGLHVLLVLAALMMWMPVAGPLPERRISYPAQMGYLFLQSVVPTVPAAALIMADGVVYTVYNKPYRLLGWSAVSDQQVAGLIMKLIGGFYLWTVILIIFFKWQKLKEAEPHARTVADVMAERESKRLASPAAR